MENKISFTGIKNLATVDLARQGFHRAKNLSMILTDDFHGKDLEAFRNELKKMGGNTSVYINEEYPDLLNLEYFRGRGNRSWIKINGTVLGENDNNLSMFSYLAKLMKRIVKNPDRTVDDSYKNYFAKDTLIYGTKFEDDDYEILVKKGSLEKLFDKEAVRGTAKDFISYIQEIMNRYFGI